MSDIVVLGAGTAGSVLTRRLLDAGLTVTLVEAGGPDDNPAIHDLSRVGELWMGPEDWQYHTVPQQHALGRRLHLPRGKVVGGSNQLNGAIWVQGSPADYDGWAAVGGLFERIVHDPVTGSGLLDVVEPELSPVQEAILDSASAWGLPLNKDYNAGDLEGVSRMQLNLRGGRRLSTWAAYMRPVLEHRGLTMRLGTLVDSVVVEAGRVTGVRVIDADGRPETIGADRVVLCSGTLADPGILLRSGIGPARELAGLGVDVVVDLPGVGRNLQDHVLVPVIFGTTRPVDPPRPFHPVTQTHWFWRSDPSLPLPDTQPINFSVPFYYDPGMSGPASGLTLHAGLIRPHSRGTVTLTSTDPSAAPAIDLGVLSAPKDLPALVASVRQCREVGRQAPLADGWGAYEVLPGPDTDDSDEAVARWVRRAVNTYHHQAGTCRMGSDDDAVVTPELAVRGVEHMMVADASVMPTVTTGNTNAPTALIAERAAELVLAG